jgi:hypothetical protein
MTQTQPEATRSDLQTAHGTSAETDSLDVAEHVTQAIHGTLRRRLTPRGTIARSVEDSTKRAGARLWLALKRHPFVGVTAAGAGGVALAMGVGVGELAVGVAVAYGAFNILVRGEPPEKAAELLAKEMEEQI